MRSSHLPFLSICLISLSRAPDKSSSIHLHQFIRVFLSSTGWTKFLKVLLFKRRIILCSGCTIIGYWSASHVTEYLSFGGYTHICRPRGARIRCGIFSVSGVRVFRVWSSYLAWMAFLNQARKKKSVGWLSYSYCAKHNLSYYGQSFMSWPIS